MFNYIDSICLVIFTSLYQLIHTHLTSYILIVLICLLILKQLWNQLKKQKSSDNIVIKLTILTLLSLTLIFTIWFICFHFHTFQLISN